MIVIRRATPPDAEAIVALSAEVQSRHAAALPRLFKPVSATSFAPAAVRELLAQPEWIVFVACADETVVGYASAEIQWRAATPFRQPIASLYVHWMGVCAEWRRRGVGRQLVDALREIARALELQALMLDVWSFNADARAFYERVGFHPQRHILSLELDSPPAPSV